MKLVSYNATENDAIIAFAMHALTHEITDDLAVTFANDYTVDIFVDDGHATVNVLRKNRVLTDSDFTNSIVYSDLASIRNTLDLVSKATTDFEVGIAYSYLR